MVRGERMCTELGNKDEHSCLWPNVPELVPLGSQWWAPEESADQALLICPELRLVAALPWCAMWTFCHLSYTWASLTLG